MSADAHRFRFFVDVVGAPDRIVALSDGDAEHVRVLRLAAGASVEIVDAEGAVWDALLTDARAARLVNAIDGAGAHVDIELIAGALTGNSFDELVDGSVQAGASRIVPYASTARDRDRLTQRRERLQRIALAAAKQSKQARIAEVADPIEADGLLALEPGILLDAAAVESLLDIDLAHTPQRILVGPADGLDPVLASQLVDRGWRLARLGPSILRAELAAPVAVALLAMRLHGRAGARA